ncbi:MAG: prolyl oligopeptidase family serine peptidase [Candidatus Omnitrophica bacterium]|nr:prolyl oligopeptidase family serine peptidase [Candidatus Omnitrophota bacterium]
MKNKHAVELIPREVLFGNPKNTSPKISPDGGQIAYLAPKEGVLNVWMRTLGGEDDRVLTHDRDRGVRRFFWAENNQFILYLQDVGGNENWRLYGIELETGKVRDFTPFENVQVRIIDHTKHYPDTVLLGINKERPQFHDVYRLDLRSGDLARVARNPGNVISWVTDYHLRVRGKVVAETSGGSVLYVRDSEETSWRELIRWEAVDALSSGPITFTRDGESLLLFDSRGANATRLVRVSSTDGSTEEVIAADERYDVSRVMIDSDTYRVQAAAFTKARTEWVVLDETLRDDFAKLRDLDEGDFVVYSRSNDDERWVIGYIKDTGPIAFHVYHRGQKSADFLFYHKPELTEYTLAPMFPIQYVSRDGLRIHGYLTYPPETVVRDLPLVVYVHGGPWARDTWGYDSTVQWMANRGYAVLQINYRGSTGYGKEFLNAGNREWGGKMHNDLIDGVQWAVAQRIADPERVAVYGGSYGGYAALVGATFTPDVFRCAVDIVGPSNLISFIQSIPPYWATFRAMLYERVGHPEKDEEFLKSRSPLFFVDQIRIPLLIAQGANDPRVKKEESEQIVEALERRGIEYMYLVFPDEGHGFVKPENRLHFYETAEKFLATYLGGRYEAQ